MDRRVIGKAALAIFAGLFTGAHARAAADPSAAKVVYHLADLDKVTFVLGNIASHYEGMGGPHKVTIALVIHGPALKIVHAKGSDSALAQRFAQFVKNGLLPAACIRSSRAQNVELDDLLPGFAIADRGGVVRLAELQTQGYAYLQP